MSKTYKEIIVKEHKKKIIDTTYCDLCRKEIRDPLYDVDEVTMERRYGTQYPEGGSGHTTSFDICGDCFGEKVEPWLREQGAEPAVTEWEF